MSSFPPPDAPGLERPASPRELFVAFTLLALQLLAEVVKSVRVLRSRG